MKAVPPIEPCPICREVSATRSKLLLVDEARVESPGKDPRLAYFASLRVDDVRSEFTKEPPLEQFVDGYYCHRCGKGFVAEAILKEGRRKYWR
jgi:hypothetical protein